MPVNDEIFEQGKNIHALASYYLRKENIDKMELALSLQEKMIWDYLKNIKYFSYEFVNSEYNLSVKVGEYFFGGRLDALVKKDETYYILDYKTGSAPKNAKYDYQTMIYSLAVKDFFKTNHVNFVYIDLKNKTEVCIELTSDLIKEYETKLLDIADKIKTEDFEPNPSPLCHWCIFSETFPNQPKEAKKLCPYFSHWTKLNKDFSVENEWLGAENHEKIMEAFKNDYKPKEIMLKPTIEIVDSARRFIIRRY